MPPCLVLVDPSPAATGALRWAAANLAAGAQAIHLVHVVTPKPMVVAGGMGAGMLVEAIHEENEVQKKAAKQFMQRVRVDAKSLGFTDVHCTILIASPGAGHAGVGHLVQEYVESKAIATVVCGSRGLGGFRRNIFAVVGLGSLSEYLVNHLHCTVCVVKPPPAKKLPK